MTLKAMTYVWRSLPWASFGLFLASGVLFFATDGYGWIATSLSSIYCLVLYQILPKTGW